MTVAKKASKLGPQGIEAKKSRRGLDASLPREFRKEIRRRPLRRSKVRRQAYRSGGASDGNGLLCVALRLAGERDRERGKMGRA